MKKLNFRHRSLSCVYFNSSDLFALAIISASYSIFDEVKSYFKIIFNYLPYNFAISIFYPFPITIEGSITMVIMYCIFLFFE